MTSSATQFFANPPSSVQFQSAPTSNVIGSSSFGQFLQSGAELERQAEASDGVLEAANKRMRIGLSLTKSSAMNAGMHQKEHSGLDPFYTDVLCQPYHEGWENSFVSGTPLWASMIDNTALTSGPIYTCIDVPLLNALLDIDFMEAQKVRQNGNAVRAYKHLTNLLREAGSQADPASTTDANELMGLFVNLGILRESTSSEKTSKAFALRRDVKMLTTGFRGEMVALNIYDTNVQCGDYLWIVLKPKNLSSQNITWPNGSVIAMRSVGVQSPLQALGMATKSAAGPLLGPDHRCLFVGRVRYISGHPPTKSMIDDALRHHATMRNLQRLTIYKQV